MHWVMFLYIASFPFPPSSPFQPQHQSPSIRAGFVLIDVLHARHCGRRKVNQRSHEDLEYAIDWYVFLLLVFSTIRFIAIVYMYCFLSQTSVSFSLDHYSSNSILSVTEIQTSVSSLTLGLLFLKPKKATCSKSSNSHL